MRLLWIGLLLAACTGSEAPTAPAREALPVEQVLAGLGKLREGGSVVVADAGLDDTGLATLLADARVPSLGSLTLADNRLGPGSVAVVAGSAKLEALTWLNLSGNALGDEGVRALAAWPRTASLTHLYLSKIGTKAEGVAALAPALGQLDQLVLATNPLGDDGARALVSVRVRRLDLTDATVQGPGARALIEGGHAVELVLDRCALGEGGGLAGLAGFAPGLRRLDVGAAGLEEADFRALAAVAEAGDLRELHISGNGAGDAAIDAVMSAPWLSVLEVLHVEGTGASKETRDKLVEAWGAGRKGLKVERR